MKKEIAIIIPGGIGTGKNNIGVPVMERLIKILAKDFRITIFSLFKVNEDYITQGFDVISISGSNFILRTVNLFSIFIRIHRKKQFTVVHGFWTLPSGFFAVILGRLFRIKSIVSVLGGDAISLPQIQYGQLNNWISKKIVLFTLAKADEVICLTDYLCNNLRTAGLRRKNIRIIPWGVDQSLFPYREKPTDEIVQFLHVANLTPVKDQITLLKAFKIISDQIPCLLTIIGEGTSENQIRKLTTNLSLTDKVNFLGVMPYEHLPEQYQKADILLHTSLSEGQSEVVTEAMSSGVVVCGTNVGLLFDQPTCCMAVKVGDDQALGDEVLKLITDTDRIHQIRLNARAWSTSHSILWTANEIKKIY